MINTKLCAISEIARFVFKSFGKLNYFTTGVLLDGAVGLTWPTRDEVGNLR